MTQSPYAPPAADLGTGLPTGMLEGRGDLSLGTALSEGWAATWRNFPLWLGAGLVSLLACLAATLTGIGIIFALPVLAWGLARFSLRMYDGGARFADVFSGFSRYGHALASMLACLLGIVGISLVGQAVETGGGLSGSDVLRVAGIVANLAVSFLILPRVSFAYLLVADQDMNGFEALRRSWEATAPCKWKVIALSLLSGLVVLAGIAVLIVGVIPAMVVSGMMWVSGYRQVFGRPAAD